MAFVTVSIDETSFMGLRKHIGKTLFLPLSMHVYYGHPIDIERPIRPLNFFLSRDKQVQLRQVGGNFPPSVYVAAGPIVDIIEPEYPGKQGREEKHIVIDCGVKLDIGIERSAHIRTEEVSVGMWMVAMGSIYLKWSGPDAICNPCVARSASILDMNPGSPEFGLIVPWEFQKNLPHDPDVVSIPCVFATYETVDGDVGEMTRMPMMEIIELPHP